MANERILHVFEAGRRGKPDEMDSIIANRLGAYLLSQDTHARFDLRVGGGYNCASGKPVVSLGGEVSLHLVNDETRERFAQIALETYNAINRTAHGADDFEFSFSIKPQSPSLAQNGKAGDSGNPIAVAVSASPNYLPWERYLAVEIRDIIDTAYHTNTIPNLRSDGKINVSAFYEGGQLTAINNIVIAAEHEKALPLGDLRDALSSLVKIRIAQLQDQYRINLGNPSITINGNGAWNRGGWQVDSGTREAKPYRDGWGSHGCNEDSFSGEDPSKVSATGSLIARQAAVSLIEAQLAKFARITLDYVIGKDEVGVNVFTNGTSSKPQHVLEDMVKQTFDLPISHAAKNLGLRDPAMFNLIADKSDYFHDSSLPWNSPLILSL